MDVSILVPTKDRVDKLSALLDSLVGTGGDTGFTWELVILNNGAAEPVGQLAERFKTVAGGTVCLINCEDGGKSASLNRGLAITTGDIIAFTDDDTVVPEDWLQLIRREFECDDSLAGLGGRVLLYNEADLPITIRTSCERESLTRGFFNPSFIPILGANMAFRREVFEQVGTFDETLGPGARIKAGEDLDFLYRVCRAGLRIDYTPDVYLYHDHGRRTQEDQTQLNAGYLVGRGAFYCKHIIRGDWKVTKLAAKECLFTTRDAIRSLFRGRWIGPEVSCLLGMLRGALMRLRVELFGDR